MEEPQPGRRFRIFEAVGIELEYMIVDTQTLDVRPVADGLLRAAARQSGHTARDGEGAPGDARFGPVTWSNELVAHVVEFKSSDPVPLSDLRSTFRALHAHFLENVRRANELLAPLGARLLPTAMHPWMDPARETRLWPHEFHEVYETFDRLFNCRTHGWANLQSMHLNLPFAGDEEFGRLHAAVRVLLPILPALAASSPVVGGRRNGTMDNRLVAYRTNSARVPSLAGRIIPEPLFSEEEYEEGILAPIRRDLDRLDPEGHLRPEFSNARGAIARFDRGTIEIRLIDMQEHPAADLLIAAAVISVLRPLTEERWASLSDLKGWSIERLQPILDVTIRVGGDAVIRDLDYLALFGYPRNLGPATADVLWDHLISPQRGVTGLAEHLDMNLEIALRTLMSRGCLAHRMVAALGENGYRADLMRLYQDLATRLERGESFWPPDASV